MFNVFIVIYLDSLHVISSFITGIFNLNFIMHSIFHATLIHETILLLMREAELSVELIKG